MEISHYIELYQYPAASLFQCIFSTDAIFVMGSGDSDAAGIQIPNEKGSEAPLKKYARQTLRLNIPKAAQGQTIQYLGVWSPTKGMLASITFPTDARIPPAVKSLP